jgi:hypothetical protein
MAPPSAEELRLSPADRRCHQGAAVFVVSTVPSFVSAML